MADSLNGIANYAEQFLGKDQKEIEDEIIEVLGSNRLQDSKGRHFPWGLYPSDEAVV